MSVTDKSILFLKGDGFIFCQPSKSIEIPFSFSGSDVRDFEVINEDLLTREIGSFIATNNLSPSAVTIVLDKSLVFIKKYTKDDIVKMKDKTIDDIQNWFEGIVPFEMVASRKITSGKDIFFMAVNSAFFLAFKRIFDTHGFLVPNVIPMSLPELSNIQELGLESARNILGKIDSLKADNLLLYSTEKKVSMEENVVKQNAQPVPALHQEVEKKDSKRLYILIGVFIFLILILIIVAFNSFT